MYGTPYFTNSVPLTPMVKILPTVKAIFFIPFNLIAKRLLFL